MDQDLREYRRKQVLEAIAARYAPKRPARAPLDVAVKPFGPSRTASSKPLFDVDGEGEEEEEKEIVPTANDEALALALQQEELGEDETEADGDLAKALALSRRDAERRSRSESEGFRVGDVGKDELTEEEEEDGDMEEVELVPSGTVTPRQIEAEEEDSEDEDEFEEVDTASTTLSSARVSRGASIAQGMETPGTASNHSNSTSMIDPIIVDDDDAEGDQVLSTFTEKRDSVYRSIAVSDLPEKAAQSSGKHAAQPTISSRPQLSPSSTVVSVRPKSLQRLNSAVNIPSPLRHVAQPKSSPISVVDDDGGPVPVGAPAPSLTLEATDPAEIRGAPSPDMIPPRSPPPPPSSLPNLYISERAAPHSPAMYNKMYEEEEEEHDEEGGSETDVNDETRSTYSWSRSPTPPPRPFRMTETEIESDNVSLTSAASPFPSHSPALKVPRDEDEDDGDLAPADVAAESDDYARFVASIKHRDLNEVRGEIDDEIRVLNAENRVAMRDSDEITSSMIAQIQASLFPSSICFFLFYDQLIDGRTTDTFETFRHPIHNRTHGSRSPMCQTGPTRPRRRYHHRRFRRIPLWRYPVLQKHFQRREIRRVFLAGGCRAGTLVNAGTLDFTRVFPGERLYAWVARDRACDGSRDLGEFPGRAGAV